MIGAGAAGLEAANVLSQRGCDVTVHDREPEIGGLFRSASRAPGKSDYMNVIRYYETVLPQRGVRFVLGEELSEVPEGRWDLVVLAVGADARRPSVGRDAPLRTAADVLRQDDASLADSYVIIGDGLVGYEVADYLATRGKKVVIAGNDPRDPEALQGIARWHFMKQRFERNGVTVMRRCTVTEIDSSGFRATDSNGAECRVNGTFEYVLACGYVSDPQQRARLAESGVKTIVVGSAASAGDAMDAIHGAFDAARSVVFERKPR